MAKSPSHTFGQLIGDLLEEALHSPLRLVAEQTGLYLDYKHARPVRGGRRKVRWTDGRGNSHDLDYVLETGGTDHQVGQPKAFIEIAWRRYTKHSRNKAQEIQGAVGPLAELHASSRPFLGVVLAGEFTEGSISQLRSHGFHVLFVPYEIIVKAFSCVNIDARFDEETPDSELESRVDAFKSLEDKLRWSVVEEVRSLCKDQIQGFIDSLMITLNRFVDVVRILPLHGQGIEAPSIQEAIRLIDTYDESSPRVALVRYEVLVHYSNGDEVRGEFQGKAFAIGFLKKLSQ